MNSFRLKSQYIWLNAEKWLIILFLATFTLNIRKVFLTPYSFLNGTFNEYMTPSFCWADLLMLSVIIIYTIKYLLGQFEQFLSGESVLCNVIRPKSIVIRFYYDVSRETFIFITFLAWIGLSVFWSQYRLIAIYKFATFLEITLFAIIALKSLKSNRWLILSFVALICSGLFQSLLGIAQFIHNKSLGIHQLGESILGPNVDGVAKIIISNEKHIRAYGTFPHPNILAAFLIIPIFIILIIIPKKFNFLRHQGDSVSRGTFIDVLPRWIIVVVLIIISLGFFLTFSRSAFLGFTISLIILFIWNKRFFSKRIWPLVIVVIFLTTIILGYLICINQNITSIISTQSLKERIVFLNVARETISAHPVLGVGIGQFVLNEHMNNLSFEAWQYQPVHNAYLLVFSELGIIGLILFLLWILTIFEWGNCEKRNNDKDLTYCLFCCILFSFLFISIFDHYFWDIKMGLIIFFVQFLFLNSYFKKLE